LIGIQEASNSAWTVILINPDILDTYTYPAHGAGRFFNPDIPNRQEGYLSGMQSSAAVYKRIRTDLEDKIRVQKMQTSSSASSTSTTSKPGKLVESIVFFRQVGIK
jgi:hypothetical protein